MYIDSQFPPLYVFWRDRYFADFQRSKTRPTCRGRVSSVENCPLYSGFRGCVARIVRCNIELMPPENRILSHRDITGAHCVTNFASAERASVRSFSRPFSDRLLFFRKYRINLTFPAIRSVERVRKTKRVKKKDRRKITSW